jgi:predicted dehydrogenase
MTADAITHERRLRMAVIGLGRVGELHAGAIAASERATLTAVCDTESSRRQDAVRRFGVAAYDSVERLLANESLDAVTIATPDHLHVEPALAAIARGCHVFCEKPLAASTAEAARVVEAAGRRGVWLGVDYNRRFGFGYRKAKELLKAGTIGALECCLLRVSDATPPAAVVRHRYVMFTTLLTHHLDLMRYFGGEICRAHAAAVDEPDEHPMRGVNISLKFTSGAIGTIVAAYRHGQSRTAEWMELGGAAGSIIVEDVTRRVIVSGLDPAVRQTFLPNHFQAGDSFYQTIIDHMQAFVDHIAAGREPPVTGHDGLNSLQLAEAAIESLKSGHSVEVRST